ncbi:MAG: hypothetical protein MZV70_02665 [Desulfobacterales bacterium]|nr:hypothetical protein [Desulfobacterales bacterium]
MTITMDQAVQTVHHAREGELPAVPCEGRRRRCRQARRHRAWRAATTTDRNYDVHMASTGGNHRLPAVPHAHRTTRWPAEEATSGPTISTVDVSCTSTCHHDKSGTTTGHTDGGGQQARGDRVACQTCHIPVYAKNAADTAATEATETHRDLAERRSGTQRADRYEPTLTKANNLEPVYRFWNRTMLGIQHERRLPGLIPPQRNTPCLSDLAADGGHQRHRDDDKLYPFKYKTADQPYARPARRYADRPRTTAAISRPGNLTTRPSRRV